MSTSRTWHLVIVAALSVAACGPDRVTLPMVPMPLQEREATYDEPTGTVPVDLIDSARAEAQRRADAARQGPRDFAAALLTAVRKRVTEAELQDDPDGGVDADKPRIRGYLDVRRICRGWDANATTPDPANGEIKMTALIENRKISAPLWGTSTTCKGRGELSEDASKNLYLDGSLGILLEGRAPTEVSEARFLMAFRGTVGTDQRQVEISFDFRFLYPQLEVRVPVSDGDVIAVVGTGEGLTFRGRNGTFACPVVGSTCTMTSTSPSGE
jgi:hypothetical protein